MKKGIGAAFFLSLLFSFTAFGAEKPEEMEPAVWERLNDGTLEYDELENRIVHFNHTYGQMMGTITENYDNLADDITIYQIEMNAFDVLYEQAVEDHDYDAAMTFMINKKTMQAMSKNSRKALKEKDATVEKNTGQYRKMFLSGGQQLMLAYNQMAVNKGTLEKQIELYSTMAGMAGTQVQLGMGTQTDILSANANLQQAKTSLLALEEKMAGVKSSLIQMAGWSYDDEVQIGPVPAFDLSQIDQIDLAADKQAALGNNYEFVGIRHAAVEDADMDGKYQTKDRKAKERKVDEAEEKLYANLENLYYTVLEKRAALTAASTAYESAKLKWDGAGRQFRLNMISRVELLGQEIAFYAAQGAYQSAQLEAAQALLNYYWGVNGFCSLE